MKYIFFYLLLIVLCACTHKKDTQAEEVTCAPATDTIATETIPELSSLESGEVFLKGQHVFEEETVLTGTHIEAPDTFIFRPEGPKLVIKDSLLFMSNRNAPLYVFHYPELTYLKTIGNKGNGPGEFINPIAVRSVNPAYLCYLLDGYTGDFYGIGPDLDKHFIKKIFNSKLSRSYTEEAHPVNEKAVLFRMGNHLFRASLENDSVQPEKIYNFRLEKAKKIPAIGAFCTNPLRNRMVFAYKYAKIVKFMDLDAKTIRTLNFEQSGFDEKSLTVLNGLDANVTHYMQALPTRDYVYITYSGRTPYVVAAETQKGNRYMYLEKYDWNGTPIKKYKLQDFCVYNVIDEKTNKLLMTTYYHDDPFVIYQLED